MTESNHANHTNVDPEDIARFNEIADKWWDKSGPCKTLHDINPVRVNFIARHIGLQDQNILDVGCGGGILTESLALAGANMTGIDLAHENVRVATDHATNAGLAIDYQEISIEALATEKPAFFDHVTCLELLEHVPDPHQVIEAISRTVKPGGFVFLSTLTRTPLAFLGAIVGAEYLLRLLPTGTHQFNQFIKPSELTSMLESSDLELVDLCGMDYNPLTRRANLSESIKINYILAARKKADH